MTVNLSGSIDYSQWRKLNSGNENEVVISNVATVEAKPDTYVSNSSEKCTDGKDDGKIGFLSALGNTVKGVGKTVVNGVKGMFTNSEGKFSLGKTLLSVGTAAVCVAVPAVGVAACAIGGVMGAVQVGKGVYNAANAETDAEAKEAWQNIGGGAFTVAASVVGAKAGVKGMKTAAAKTDAGSALQTLSDSGTKLSAKTAGQYAKAFAKDGYNSGKYNLGQIKTTATAYSNAAKIKYTEAKANKIDTSGALTSEELHTINNAKYQKMYASDDTLAALDKIDKVSNSVKAYGKAAEVKYAEAKASKLNTKGALTSEELHTVNNAKYQKMFASDDTLAALEKIDNIPNATKNAVSNLKGTSAKIYEALTSGETTYAQAVQEYGYENVAQVLEYLGGTLYATENT